MSFNPQQQQSSSARWRFWQKVNNLRYVNITFVFNVQISKLICHLCLTKKWDLNASTSTTTDITFMIIITWYRFSNVVFDPFASFEMCNNVTANSSWWLYQYCCDIYRAVIDANTVTGNNSSTDTTNIMISLIIGNIVSITSKLIIISHCAGIRFFFRFFSATWWRRSQLYDW